MSAFKKRTMERYDLKMPANLTFEGEAGKQSFLKMMTKNICSGGALLETSSSLPLGTEVKIDLVLPLEQFKNLDAPKAHIAVSGEVIRSGKSGLAICFNEHFRISSIPE
jgi:hypothetical protein